jgi:hypothetical protein
MARDLEPPKLPMTERSVTLRAVPASVGRAIACHVSFADANTGTAVGSG